MGFGEGDSLAPAFHNVVRLDQENGRWRRLHRLTKQTLPTQYRCEPTPPGATRKVTNAKR